MSPKFSYSERTHLNFGGQVGGQAGKHSFALTEPVSASESTEFTVRPSFSGRDLAPMDIGAGDHF